MDLAPDPARERVLASFGVGAAALLGWGGEASVWALGGDRVLRVLHAGADGTALRRAHDLVRELSAAPAPFALAEVLEVGEREGRWWSVERRVAGRSLADALHHLDGAERAAAVVAHLDASAALGDLHLEPRPWFGDLVAPDPLRSPTWRGFLEARAARSLAAAGPDFAGVDAAALADDLPEVATGSFLHLDAFPGNVMVHEGRVTAVLDVGPSSAVGDRRLDPLASAVYVATPHITPAARPADADVASAWLRDAGLLDLLEPARRWLAASWAFAVDDHELQLWCRAVLLGR